MKTIFALLLLVLISSVMAQSPQAIKYQALIRSEQGAILQNVEVEFKLTIQNENGISVYSETHALQSNQYGLVSFNIGEGQVTNGDFSSIAWEANSLYLKTEFKISGSNTYTDLGNSPLLSVPYALFAQKAGAVDESDPVSWKITGNTEADNLFLGSTDSTSVSFRSNNIDRMRIAANGTVQIATSINNQQSSLILGSSEGKGVVFIGGNSSPTDAPMSGGGKRLMWFPYKAAFRVGEVSGANWDTDSIGMYSFATGFNNSSKGNFSASFGYQNKSRGIMSFVSGSGNQMNAYLSTGFGENLKAESYGSFVIGKYNIAQGSPDAWVSTDPLFVIGNGNSDVSRSNAIVVLKNSNTCIGLSSPNIGNQLEVGRLGYGGNVVFNGSSAGSPDTLNTFTGNRMVWLPKKGAFRAGEDAVGGHWTFSTIGQFSAAFGSATLAQGNYSFATGNNNEANASYSVSMGLNNTADGSSSICVNSNNNAVANNSSCFGFYSKTSAYASLAIGRFNTYNAANSPTTWLSSEPLMLAGNGTGDASRANAMVLYKSGNMTISGTLTQSSDIRLKTAIQPLLPSLQNIQYVQPISYEFKDKETHPEGRQIGFSAQEIQKFWPELVREDENGFLSVDYAGMTVVLLQAMKEQQTQIQNLQLELQQLKKQ